MTGGATVATAGKSCYSSASMDVRRSTIRLGALVLWGIVLAGCIPENIQRWEGKPRSLLLEAWGQPATERRQADGWTSTTYVFEYLDTYGGGNICQVVFDSDTKGIIRKIRWHGDCLEMPRL